LTPASCCTTADRLLAAPCALPAPPVVQIAASLRAEKLILMTDVPGVMRDKDDHSTKFTSLSIRECKELVDEGVIAGGMIPKVWVVCPKQRVCPHLDLQVQAVWNRWRMRGHQDAFACANAHIACCGSYVGTCSRPQLLSCPWWLMRMHAAKLQLTARLALPNGAQVECCIRSLSQGVNATHIIDGRQPHSLLMELLTTEGVGSMITG